MSTTLEARDSAQLLAARARAALEGGDRLVALDLARAAVALEADCFSAHRVLSDAALEGISFRALLGQVHAELAPRTYLEIGIAQGETLVLARAPTLAIGVDPEPRLVNPPPAHIRVFGQTSDRFFADYDLRTEFRGLPLDLAFIDGMHLFEFALRDFMNVERFAVAGTRVLLHDCYPLDAATSTRERSTTFWTGDVWKLVLCLKKYRPDLGISTLAARPTGLAVVHGLDPSSTILAQRYEEICREFVPLPYAAIASDKPVALNLVPGDWQTARRLLRG